MLGDECYRKYWCQGDLGVMGKEMMAVTKKSNKLALNWRMVATCYLDFVPFP